MQQQGAYKSTYRLLSGILSDPSELEREAGRFVAREARGDEDVWRSCERGEQIDP